MAKKLGKAAAMAALLGGAALLANRGKGESKAAEKSDTSMMDELAGMDRSTRRGDSSMEDELAGMSRKASARGIKRDNSRFDELAGMDRSKRARPAAADEMTGAEIANENQRLVNKSVSRGGPGLDRMGESAVGRMIQRFRNRSSSPTADMDEGSGGIGENIVGAKRGGKIKAKKYAGGGSVGSASKRADGCAMRGKTKGRMV